MSTKKWIVTLLSVIPSSDGLSDVVMNVYWLCTASDSGKAFSTNGCTQVPAPNQASFTPYSSLSESQVLQWVFDVIGAQQVADMEAAADKGLQDVINPPIVYPTLPWNNRM